MLSPAPMLQFLERYRAEMMSDVIGEPLNGGRVNGAHNGILPGCNTFMWQRSDGLNLFMFFNEDASGSTFGDILAVRIASMLDRQTDWPTSDVAGFWAEANTNPLPAIYGSYDRPFHGVPDALNTLSDGSKLNLKAGSHGFTGTISTKLRIRAPLGSVRIGG